jgi:DNA repair photolyase
MTRFAGTKEPWGSFVQCKINIAERLALQLRKIRSPMVMLSSVTDPYQPMEGRYRLTRGCLDLLAQAGGKISVMTKSDLVLRDMDILATMPSSDIGFSIATLDERIAGLLEPGAPSPLRRLRALRTLSDAGIRAWAFIAPAIPGITDTEDMLDAIAHAARDAGAIRVACDPLSFYPAAVTRLRSVIACSLPDAGDVFAEACRDPQVYENRLRTMAGIRGIETV